MRHSITGLCLLTFLSIFSLGCTPSNSDSHADSEATFTSATTSLVEMRDAIRNGFASGDTDKAHGPLHEIGHVLTSLPKLAEKEGKSAEDVKAINEATESLLDAFGEVDKTFHGGEGATYGEVAAEVEAAMTTITGIAGVENTAAPTGSGSGTTGEGSGTTDEVPAAGSAPVDAPGGH